MHDLNTPANGEFRAWLSSEAPDINAKDNIRYSEEVSYISLPNSGQIIAAPGGLLTPPLKNSVEEFHHYIWTGTAPSGVKLLDSTCSSWTSDTGSYAGEIGSSAQINNQWTNTSNHPVCSANVLNYKLYCFESPPTMVQGIRGAGVANQIQ